VRDCLSSSSVSQHLLRPRLRLRLGRMARAGARRVLLRYSPPAVGMLDHVPLIWRSLFPLWRRPARGTALGGSEGELTPPRTFTDRTPARPFSEIAVYAAIVITPSSTSAMNTIISTSHMLWPKIIKLTSLSPGSAEQGPPASIERSRRSLQSQVRTPRRCPLWTTQFRLSISSCAD
jgi:hypothetical protein